jgi:hypothetical protein
MLITTIILTFTNITSIHHNNQNTFGKYLDFSWNIVGILIAWIFISVIVIGIFWLFIEWICWCYTGINPYDKIYDDNHKSKDENIIVV